MIEDPLATPCMVDNDGAKVAAWLPHMQSSSFLRAAITRGIRTDECWAELSVRAQRGQAAAPIIAALRAERGLPAASASEAQIHRFPTDPAEKD